MGDKDGGSACRNYVFGAGFGASTRAGGVCLLEEARAEKNS